MGRLTFPTERGPFLEWLLDTQEPTEEPMNGAGVTEEEIFTHAGRSPKFVGKILTRVIDGEPVPREEFSISIHKDEAVFCFRLNGITVRDAWRKQFSNLPRPVLKYIQTELSEYLEHQIPMNKRVVETFNPKVMLRTLKDPQGRPLDKARLDEVSQQTLVHHAPLLVDLVRFCRENMNNSDKVQKVMVENSEEVVGIRLTTSIPELTSMRGKPAKAILDELRGLMRKPIRVLFQSSKFKGRIRRQAPTLTTGIIRDLAVDVGKPLVVEISSLLMAIEGGFRLLPDNLRERWARFPERRQPHHEAAWGWAMLARFEYHEEGVEKLLKVWGIELDRKDPKRTWQRFQSCIRFLRQTMVLIDHRVLRLKNGKPDMIRFHFDPFELRHIERAPPEIQERNILQIGH